MEPGLKTPSFSSRLSLPGDLSPSRMPPRVIRAKDTLITQEILRDLETVKIGAEDQLLEEKVLLVLIIILKITKVLMPGIQELRIDFIIDREP